jgi:HEAT repeat protein
MVGAEDGEVVRGLTGALGDEAATVRLNAALALGKIGPPSAEAVPALTALMNDENRYVRHYAAVGLRRIDTPDARETLMDALFTSRWCPITTKETPY